MTSNEELHADTHDGTHFGARTLLLKLELVTGGIASDDAAARVAAAASLGVDVARSARNNFSAVSGGGWRRRSCSLASDGLACHSPDR